MDGEALTATVRFTNKFSFKSSQNVLELELRAHTHKHSQMYPNKLNTNKVKKKKERFQFCEINFLLKTFIKTDQEK